MSDDTAAAVLEPQKEHRENRKKNLGRKVEPNQARAVAKFIRVPPRKARLVIDEVRGRYVQEALAFLSFIPNRAAVFIGKVISSAVANAANNHNLDPNSLKLIEARVDEGPRMKRVQPRAQGRAYRILKRMSHITVVVQEVAPKPRKPKKQTRGRAQAAREARQAQEAAEATTAATAPAVSTATPPPAGFAESAPKAPPAETPVAPAVSATETAAAQSADAGEAPQITETTPEEKA
jgi:large subunit ribosomal protein L22